MKMAKERYPYNYNNCIPSNKKINLLEITWWLSSEAGESSYIATSGVCMEQGQGLHDITQVMWYYSHDCHMIANFYFLWYVYISDSALAIELSFKNIIQIVIAVRLEILHIL